MRAVLDPNVLIAALLSRGGTPAQIVTRWLHGEFELIVSAALLDELARALGYPKLRARVDQAEADAFVELLRTTAVPASDPPATPRSADSADDYLIALAASERAILVSGDRDLLDLSESFPIESPADFLERLSARA